MEKKTAQSSRLFRSIGSTLEKKRHEVATYLNPGQRPGKNRYIKEFALKGQVKK